MLTEQFITNMVIGVSIVVVSLMIVLIFQIYKDDSEHKKDGK
ncbi:hypothetical protein ACFL2V_04885 [Pseudomonadota bacterium]